MNDICMKDCHACTLQDGVRNKSLCATLLMPAMIERLSARIAALEAALVRPPALNEIALHGDPARPKAEPVTKEPKPLKPTSNENTEI